MGIAKKGGYSGGGSASEMGPPANQPIASPSDFRQMWADAECRANEQSAMLGKFERLADEYGWKVNDPDVPVEARKVYALVMRDLYAALAANPYLSVRLEVDAQKAGSHLRRGSRPSLSGPQQEPNAAKSSSTQHDPSVCFCGRHKDEHPPGPPCPPPPPPGVMHG